MFFGARRKGFLGTPVYYTLAHPQVVAKITDHPIAAIDTHVPSIMLLPRPLRSLADPEGLSLPSLCGSMHILC